MKKLSTFNSQLSTPKGFTQHQFGAGFTLIELLVAVAVLGAIIAAVVGLLNPWEKLQRTRDAQRKSDLAQLQTGLALYYADHGRYPFSTEIPQDQIDWEGSASHYLKKIPSDPLPNQKYSYHLQQDGTYKLLAKLENCSDPQAAAGTNCTSDPYNYCVSPNGPCLVAAPTPTPTRTPTPTPTVGPGTPTPTSTPGPTPILVVIKGKHVDQNGNDVARTPVDNDSYNVYLNGDRGTTSAPAWEFNNLPLGNYAVVPFYTPPPGILNLWEIWYSICPNCTNHDPSTYTYLYNGTLILFTPSNLPSGFADVYFKYIYNTRLLNQLRTCDGTYYNKGTRIVDGRVIFDYNQDRLFNPPSETPHTGGARVSLYWSADGTNYTLDPLTANIKLSDSNGCYKFVLGQTSGLYKVVVTPPNNNYVTTNEVNFVPGGPGAGWSYTGANLGIVPCGGGGQPACPTPAPTIEYTSPPF